MATKTEIAVKAAAKRASPTKGAAPVKKPAATTPIPKSLKDTFIKASLVSHLAEQTVIGIEAVKAVLFYLENIITAPLHKKGASKSTLPGLFKVTSVKIPATKCRFSKDPFTGVNQWSEAKSATMRVRVRALRKAKNTAINN